MKKAFMLIAAIALLAAPVFAIDADVSGSVKATFGWDIENGSSGFENSNDIKVVVPFIEADSTMGIEGDDVWGEISISDLSVGLLNGGLADMETGSDDDDDDTVSGTITGKVHIGDIFIGVHSAPDVDKNYANNTADVNAAGLNQGDINNDTEWLGETGGMSLGFDNGTHNVEVSISSASDWDDDAVAAKNTVAKSWMSDGQTAVTASSTTENVDNAYIIAATTGLDFDVFTFDGAFFYANRGWALKSSYIGFGVKPAFEMDFSETMGLEVAVGMDGVIVPKNEVAVDMDGFYFDLAPALTLNLTAENDDEDRSYFEVGAYLASSTSVNTTNNMNMTMNMTAKFEEVQDMGFVDGLGATITFSIIDLLDRAKTADTALYALYALDVSAKYEVVDGLTPSIDFGMGTDNNKVSLGVGVEAGADFTGITNTTFTAKYASTSLVANTANAVVADKGTFTLETKISF